MPKLTKDIIARACELVGARIDAIGSPNYDDLFNKTPGAIGTCWCAWANVAPEDWRELWEESHVAGIWSAARIAAVESGKAEPSAEEIEQWHRAYCRHEADSGQVGGVLIIPTQVNADVTVWVLVELGVGHPYDKPVVLAVFSSQEEAVATIERDGAVSGWV